MAATNGPETPRQKMINLMYIILTAMLALNVSSDVLNGFSLVEKSLSKTTDNATAQNNALYRELSQYYEKNPEKVEMWYERGNEVKALSDSLYNYAERLKVEIVKKSDGKNGDVNNISRPDNLEAATYVMLSNGEEKGMRLYEAINSYRESIVNMVEDNTKKTIIADNLSTEVSETARENNKNWQQAMFENMPTAAAVTILTKLQNDIRYAETEVLHNLIRNIDVGDFRVNQINAYVIPNSRNVIRGGRYSVQLVLSAEDSTQRPRYFIGDRELPANQNGRYEMTAGAPGNYTLRGHIEMDNGDGTTTRRDFREDYTVVEPTATVSPMLVNVLYAGIDNPMEISVPGVPQSQITASVTNGNGTLTRAGNIWIAKPTDVGKECIISVSAQVDGRSQVVDNKTFRVRALPSPLPFIVYQDANGATQRYKGGVPLARPSLLSSNGIIAALDDDFLEVNYRVLSFEVTFIDIMGDAAGLRAEGAEFTPAIKERFRRLTRGNRFFISRVRAVGPDGVEQLLPSIEVVVN